MSKRKKIDPNIADANIVGVIPSNITNSANKQATTADIVNGNNTTIVQTFEQRIKKLFDDLRIHTGPERLDSDEFQVIYNRLKATYPTADFNTIDFKTGNNLLLQALSYKYCNIARFLIEENVNVNFSSKKSGNNALHYAVNHHSLAPLIPSLLSKGADFTARNNQGKTPYEIIKDKLAIDQYQSFTQNLKNSLQLIDDRAKGNPDLLKAIKEYNPVAVLSKKLLVKEQDFNPQIKGLFNALSSNNQISVDEFKTNLDKVKSECPNFDINIKHFKTGNTLLSAAISGKHFDIMEYLLTQEGVDVNNQNKKGKTALNFAVSKKNNMYNNKAALALMKAGADCSIKDITHKNPYDIIKEQCSSIDSKVSNGEKIPRCLQVTYKEILKLMDEQIAEKNNDHDTSTATTTTSYSTYEEDDSVEEVVEDIPDVVKQEPDDLAPRASKIAKIRNIPASDEHNTSQLPSISEFLYGVSKIEPIDDDFEKSSVVKNCDNSQLAGLSDLEG